METIANLPGGQVLSSGELVIKDDKIVSSITTFYIKSDFAITNKRFVSHYPKIVLGFLPLGFDTMTFNIKQISGVKVDVSYKIFKLLIGIIAFLFAFGSLVSGEMGSFIIAGIVGIIFLSLAIQVYISVATSGGITRCPVVFWEKQKAILLINNLNSVIAENS